MKLLNEFWAFVRERELIRLRRLADLPRDQWTQDEIFQTYSFTNVKREHDRMSMFLDKIYARMWRGHDEDHKEDLQNSAQLLVNCAAYRYFGTEQSAEAIGFYTWASDDSHSSIGEWLDYIRNLGLQGDLRFTSAYIVPNCGDTRDKYEVVCDILKGIDDVSERVVVAMHQDGGSWEKAVKILTSCWGCGSFMAKEIILDYIMATRQYPADWRTWTPVGPGGCRGAGWVLTGWKERMPETMALNVIRDIYATAPIHWPERWTEFDCEAVRLDLTDIQFQLCEFDKMNRVKNALGRPKRKFKPKRDVVTTRIRDL